MPSSLHREEKTSGYDRTGWPIQEAGGKSRGQKTVNREKSAEVEKQEQEIEILKGAGSSADSFFNAFNAF